MVRLRSSRWYSADGQRRSRATVSSSAVGMRRVLSLCLLLGLVIVLMQKVSDPKHVQQAFQVLGLPLGESPSSLAKETPQADGLAASTAISGYQVLKDANRAAPITIPPATIQWRNVCQDLIPRLLDDASEELINELSLSWFAAARSSESGVSEVAILQNPNRGDERLAAEQPASLQAEAPAVAHSIEEYRAASDKLLANVKQELASQIAVATGDPRDSLVEWNKHLDQFIDHWRQWMTRVATGTGDRPKDSVFGEVVGNYLDQRLIGSLRDAAPWTKGESVPFYRLLQSAAEMSFKDLDADPPLVDTLQLQAESKNLRGTLARFRGSVRRVERVNRQRLEFNVDGYWLLWLRGADQSDQPVAIYASQSMVKRLELLVADGAFPDVEVLGLVGKKFAYGASAGTVEVAPTIFSASIFQIAEPEPTLSGKSAGQVGSDARWALTIGAVVAALILVPILTNWRRRFARRSRARVTGAILALVFVSDFAGQTTNALSCDTLVNVAQQDAAQQTPPWAQTAEAAPADILLQQLENSLSLEFAKELQSYIDGDVDRFPDEALKLAFQLRKLGRQSDLGSLPSMTVASANIELKSTEIAGLVRLAMPVALSEDQQLWFQLDDAHHLVRLQVEIAGGTNPQLLTIFAEQVPSQWLIARQLLQPIMIRGVGVQELTSNGDTSRSPIPLCVFASRVQWQLPAGVSQGDHSWQPPLAERQYRLLSGGWDLGLLDFIERRQQQPLEGDDIQPFYSLMNIASSLPSDGAGDKNTVFEVLNSPKSYAGAPIAWPVRLVRGTKVPVQNAKQEQLLGAKEYYQFDGFVDIGRKVINYRSGDGNDANVIPFQGEFPISLVSRDCPAAFKPTAGQDAINWDIGRTATATGFFYRLWSYESEMMNKIQPTSRQVAPLVIVQTLEPRNAAIAVRSSDTGWFAYALTIVMVIISGTIIWLSRPHRRK